MIYLKIFPIVILVNDIIIFDRISPKTMVMALPKNGRKAKKPIHAP